MRVAVVGANRGIGLALVQKLTAEGHQVDAFCRAASPDLEKAKPSQIIAGFDVQKWEAQASLISKAGVKSWDWLLHVAGILTSDTLQSLQAEDLRRQFEVNTLAPLMTARNFLPFLKSGSKIGLLTSRMGSIADNTSGGYYGYRVSKAGLNMVGKSLAEDLRPQGVTVLLLHPGYVRTDMTGHSGQISAQESAEGLYRLMAEKNLQNSGEFWHTNGEALPW